MTPDEFRRWGHETVDWLAKYMEEVEELPVVATVEPGEIRARLPEKPPVHGEPFSSVLRDLDERLAGDILERIAGGSDFWSEVYEPFSRNDISRDTVRLVIEMARTRAGKTMPAVARYLKAVGDGDSAEEQRRLFKFKNFLYKTVRI